MLVTNSLLEGMYHNFDLRFRAAFTRGAPWYARIATKVTSTGRENRYPWNADQGPLREWVGERIINNLKAHATVISNRDFERTIGIPLNDIEDDNLGVYNTEVDTLAYQASRWPDDLVAAALKSGETAMAYDGQSYFNASHPIAPGNAQGGTYSNRFSLALTPDNYATVRASMSSIVGEGGRSLGISPRLLVVPPALEVTALRIVNSDLVPSAAGTASMSNVLKGTAEVLVIPELAGEDDAWYLMDVSRPLKPFIFQERKAPRLVSKGAATDDNVFWHRKVIYGVDARGNAGFSLPFLAAKSRPV